MQYLAKDEEIEKETKITVEEILLHCHCHGDRFVGVKGHDLCGRVAGAPPSSSDCVVAW